MTGPRGLAPTHGALSNEVTGMTTIRDLAAETLSHFVTRHRDGAPFYTCSDDAPSWVRDLCREAHSQMMPDDKRYEMIHAALNALDDADDTDEARDTACEPPTYTADLTAWLASRNDRAGYVDEAISEMGVPGGILDYIGYGWAREMSEVFDLVLHSLEAELDAREVTADVA